jgi:hypothetical protein
MDITSFLIGKEVGGGSAPTPTYQDKEITILQNGEQTITADSGYDALSSVEITTNVPQPSGKITITQNGTDIDVSSYATADVSVGGSAPTTIAEYNQQIQDMTTNFFRYLDTTLIAERTPYTNQSVNLYTPDIDCKFYVVRKRNNVYSVVWTNNIAMFRDYSNMYCGSPIVYSTNYAIPKDKLELENQPVLQFRQANNQHKGYFSNESFSTADAVVEAMLNNQLTYSQSSQNMYGVQADTPYMCPYSNMVLINSGKPYTYEQSKIISHNETIVAMS